MRLLEFDSHGQPRLTRDLIENIPSYAILSHTWGADEEEVTFTDLSNGPYKNKAGYAKIRFCMEQARKDGLKYCWVDTCCIDKSSQPELNEALVSMFRWYRNADRCYAYLADVSTCKRNHDGIQTDWDPAFRSSRWFTRGWTLQELLAPDHVEFYSRDWERLGDKRTLQQQIHEITSIPVVALCDGDLSGFHPKEKFRWAANRKTKRTEDRAYCLLGVFGVSMPVVYGEGDNAFDRLKDEIGKSYRSQLNTIEQTAVGSASHRLAECGPKLNQVAVREAPPHERRQSLLASLSFDQMDTRRLTIKRAYSTTCKWFLKHPAYNDWTDSLRFHEHHGLLWINGKPGAGKSTLVKFAHAYANKTKSQEEIVTAFFFNARGEELERSTIGMYRALLFQILTREADLQTILDQFSLHAEHPGPHSTWTIEMLQEMLSAVVVRLGNRHLKCFVDALDECDEQQVRDMVAFFEELGQIASENGNKLYICFASRHYPTIEIRSGRQLILEREGGHAEDLATYVQNHLHAGQSKSVDEVRSHILEKANGVFMWAVLVVDILNKEFRSGRMFAVKRRLAEIPEKLSDLFKDILRRDTTNMADFLLCLQWILFARRPLKREEFYFAMVSGLDVEFQDEWDPEHVTVDDMNRFVLNSSKGLAELTRSKSPTVQFIHESVRDFLIKDNGFRELSSELWNDLPSLSHDRLKRCCESYLNVDVSIYWPSERALPKASSESARNLRQLLTSKFPFLQYACQNVLYHANEAARSISQNDFLEKFALQAWVNIANLLERYKIRRHTRDVNLLYLCAEYDFARLVKTTPRCNRGTMFCKERYQHPVFAALAKGCEDAARTILVHHEIDWNLHDRSGRTILQLAALHGRNDVVRLLLDDDTVDIEAKDKQGMTALLLGAENENDTTAQLLLDAGVDTDGRDSRDRTALMKVAGSGSVRASKLLLDRHANIAARDGSGNTALLHAAKFHQGHETIQALLDANADIEARNNQGRTALMNAASNRATAILRLLLSRNANAQAQDHEGRTALMFAADGSGGGVEEAMRLLLDYNADIEARDEGGMTALMYAAIDVTGRVAVQTLLDRNADTEARAKNGQTALIYVAQRSDVLSKDAAQLLLDANARVDAQDDSGKTALMYAAVNRCHGNDVLRLLLHKKADVEARDKDGKTALIHAAAFDQGKEAIQKLLDNHADIEAQDEDGKTALMQVFSSNTSGNMKALLEGNPDTETRDKYGITALGWAVKDRRYLAITLLVARGANVDSKDINGQKPASYATDDNRSLVLKLLYPETYSHKPP